MKFNFLDFVKKRNDKNFRDCHLQILHLIVDDDSKKSVKIVVTEFYKLFSKKCKEYTFKNLKKGGCHRATRWVNKIYETEFSKCLKTSKGKVHKANESGLNGIIKI